ncbi:hypothetical protein BD770DRAFT_142284 [Pilaira anomala]|nr:hypothetical protein BD770DRAFT_142284 [Pilaira anomala]
MTTNILEINTHPHHISYFKKQHTFDSGYHSADDLSYISSPTTSTSSRRSSFSSFASCHTPNRINTHRQSFPPPKYNTLKAAHERIEYLEEQIRSRRKSNETVVQGMTVQIDAFLKGYNRSEPLSYCSTDSSLGPVMDALKELKLLVTQNNKMTTQEEIGSSAKENNENKILFSTQIIDNWIQSATQHKSKQAHQNVEAAAAVVAAAKYQKIVQDIQILSQQHTETKKQLQKVTQSEEKYKSLLQEQIKKSEAIEQDKVEIEQLLDEVRNEMEDMMEELNTAKSERERYFEKSERLEFDLKNIEKNEGNADILALQGLLRESETQVDQLEDEYQNQITTYVSKTESLKAQLKKAEQSVAELSLLLEVQKRQQISTEMEQALRRTLAERDGELAKVKFKLEKSYTQNEQMKAQQEKQMKMELNTRLEAVEQSLKNQYKKEIDTFQLHTTREIRELAGKMVELEVELEDYHRQHEQDVKQAMDTQQKLKALQTALKDGERLSKASIHELEGKIKVLESEVLLLYGKNLELAQHLGELDE